MCDAVHNSAGLLSRSFSRRPLVQQAQINCTLAHSSRSHVLGDAGELRTEGRKHRVLVGMWGGVGRGVGEWA